MYCIECGTQIPENSKFCSSCGKKQSEQLSVEEKIADSIIEKEVIHQIMEARKPAINYDFIQKCFGWYLAWILLHLAILLIWSKSISGDEYFSDKFWPFSDWEQLKSYDFREFLVYSVFPLAIILIISLVHNPNKQLKD